MRNTKEDFYMLSGLLQREILHQVRFDPPDAAGLQGISTEDFSSVHVRSFADTYLRYVLRTLVYGRNEDIVPLTDIDSLLYSWKEELQQRVGHDEKLEKLILGLAKKVVLDKASSGFTVAIKGERYGIRSDEEDLLITKI